MTPHKMLLGHNPDQGVYGDCVRTVLASLLDLQPQEVPHFFRHGQAQLAWDEIDAWLADRSLCIVTMTLDGNMSLSDILANVGHLNSDIYYIVCGKGIAADHLVIACNGEIVMDPSHSNSGLSGPTSMGVYYIMFLSPLIMKRKA